ncbi:MAG: FecCD family ABC transporter permease [Ilumatobacteraceae bacterium]
MNPASRRGALDPRLVAAVLVLMLVGAVLLSALIGAYRVSVGDVFGAVLRRIGFGSDVASDPVADELVWVIRLPRIVLGVLVGACLATAGAVMQGAFANPLSEPGIVGVSSGAMAFAALQIVTGFSPFGIWTLPVAAFIGGLLAVAVVYATARHDGRTEVLTLVLMGIAINALAGAAIGLLAYLSDDASSRSLTSWTLGSLSQSTWEKVWLVAPTTLVGLVAAMSMSRTLDLLSLGDRSARLVGVDVERARIKVLVVVAIMAASAVSVSGIVLFVGLLVPHVVRLFVGPGHRHVLPLSVLFGSVVVSIADLLARTVVEPAELPLGVLTSLLGAPVFIWQLRRLRSRHGGWA